MGSFSYFGYGSLINDATRPVGHGANNAVLKGWRREWRVINPVAHGTHGLKGVCSLGIAPDAHSTIAGVVVQEPLCNLAALDEREHRYERLVVEDGALAPCPQRDVFVYRSLAEHRIWAHDACPILRSYVDCVMQGVLRRFGEAGLADFIHTTDGWDLPLLNDRDAPLYPRSVVLTEDERALIDAYVDAARS